MFHRPTPRPLANLAAEEREDGASWSVEEKLRIVAEAEEPGARIAEVAARHGSLSGIMRSCGIAS